MDLEVSYPSNIIFSLENDQVWAHWEGADVSVRLGSAGQVVEMMRDFLAQTELAERLTGGRTG